MEVKMTMEEYKQNKNTRGVQKTKRNKATS